MDPTELNAEVVLCKTCERSKRRDCDGEGWLEALGPYRDGSYITSRPCPNENPLAAV